MEQQDKLQAAVFRRLLKHLDDNKDVQNIDLMILAGFCRNCLGKWTLAEAENLGIDMDKDAAMESVYGMPYSQWKQEHQLPATQEQLDAFANKTKK